MTRKPNERECRKSERPILLPQSVSPTFPRAAAVLTLRSQAGRGGNVFGQRACGIRRGAFRGVLAWAGIARAAGDDILPHHLPVRDDGVLKKPVIPRQIHQGAQGPGMPGSDSPRLRREPLGVA